ncbi:SpoIIE family protein phosphatase [Kitasatospora purpeofusca]|uniref:SpoIIE family protein phosphatase n=1 Tax=Kitasatospora purpeofusca TaxID=67352 RepID=UPI0036D3A8A3
MVNHLNEKYRELQRESDRLRFSASSLPTQDDVHRKLATTSNLLEKAREERARAEIEQQEALQLKDVALRRADALQHELDRLRGEPQDASLPTPSELTWWDPIPATQDPELDDIARALATASAVNDENEQLTQEARENLGLEPADDMLSALSVPAPDNADNRINNPEAESGAAETIVGLGEPNLTLAELAASEAVFGQTPTGFILFDDRLRLQRVNNAFASGMALAPTDLEGLTPHDIFPNTEADRLTAALRKVLASGEPVFDLRFHAAVPNRLWAVSLYRLNGAAGQPMGVAGQVSDVTSRHVAEREADGVRRNLALLNEASAHIGSTLDLETTAKELLDVVVPPFCDLATVDLYTALLSGETVPSTGRLGDTVLTDDSGELRRVAVSSVVGGASSVLGSVTGLPIAEAGGTLCYPRRSPHARALRTGRSVVPEPGPDPLLRSTLIVPLVARDQILGLVQLSRAIGSEPFDARDVAIAEELVARAAVCIDNARLYRREHERALILQRSLLPPGNPVASGLEIARRYLPSNNNTEVGGDWFDVIPLPGNRTALVIGDVMGRGLRAATVMGQLRTVLRTLAMLDLSPSAVLTALDDTVCAMAGDSPQDEVYLATCLYAVYDAVTKHCMFANAGHLPPVLLSPGEPARMLDVPPNPPLGVGGEPFEDVELTLPGGAVLGLFTDGLVESRKHHIDEGLRALRTALSAEGMGLEQLCDHVLGELNPHHGEDDIALLMARTRPPTETPAPPPTQSRLRLSRLSAEQPDGSRSTL